MSAGPYLAVATRRLPLDPEQERGDAMALVGSEPGAFVFETRPTPQDALTTYVSLGAAFSLIARGREVSVKCLRSGAASLLRSLEMALSTRAESRWTGETTLHLRFPARAGGSEEARRQAPSPIDAPRALLELLRLHSDVDDSYAGVRLVGSFGYDLVESYEPLPPASQDIHEWPDFELYLPDRWVHCVHCVHCSHLDARRGEVELGAIDFTGNRAQARAELDSLERQQKSATTSTQKRHVCSSPTNQAVEVDLDDAAYEELVRRAQASIARGDVFQIVPSRTFSTDCSDPVDAYIRLRELNPSPYSFFFRASQGVLFGASPETAVRVDEKGRVQVSPIAGTRPRGRTADGRLDRDLDSRLEAELCLDGKELAEHMMLVDLARNDVARIAEPGTRGVDALLQVARYSHVMHLVSEVSGLLREDLDPFHAYVGTMNMGTLVGAPKVRAAQLLRELEATRRGPYGGGIGYVTAEGQLDTAIVIRSALVQDGTAAVRAGAGVVSESIPASEAAETRNKAAAVLTAIAISEADRSGRATGSEGNHASAADR